MAFQPSGIASEVREALTLWRPPEQLMLDEWADKHFKLSRESSSSIGAWTTLPYQRGWLRAMTDPHIERVSIMKPARVGYSKCLDILIAYHLAHDPAPVMCMQPTLPLAQRFSKKEIAPMLRDVEPLRGLIAAASSKDASNTILEKSCSNGASLMLCGAQSASDLSAVSIRVLLCDETDRYPASAGDDGDPVELAIARTGYFWNRTIVMGSTPVNEGESQIDEAFQAGDQRRYFVPCPHCGHRDVLTMFRDDPGGGFWLNWPEKKPELAYFVCPRCESAVEHHHKRWMVENGEWRGGRDFEKTVNPATGRGHASFFIWAAYSFSPNASWGNIARTYVASERGGPLKLKTFYNTWLARCWRTRGEAPNPKALFERRVKMDPGVLPSGVEYITAGVDVQGDGFPFEIVGWTSSQQSWSLATGKITGDTSTMSSPVWGELDRLLDRTWRRPDGSTLGICHTAIDSGYATTRVYAWARRHDRRRVMVVKGFDRIDADRVIANHGSTEVDVNGQPIDHGVDVWHVAVSLLKGELCEWLNLPIPPEGQPFPNGWCHFVATADHDETYFDEITSEQRVIVRSAGGKTSVKWVLLPKRQNHRLDCRNYARAAAIRWGIDRLVDVVPEPPPAKTPAPPPARGSWLPGRRDRRSWL